MRFKTDNQFLYVEGIQFRNGEYETTNENEIEILKRYSDSISVLEEEPAIQNETIEESTVEPEVVKEESSKKSKKSEEE